MKRFILAIIIMALLASLCGCDRSADSEMIMPAAFYYHSDLDAREDFNNIFIAESHEAVQFQNDYILLLNNYFTGPVSEKLINPFPPGLEVVSLETKENTTYIILSDQIAKLSGLDLTIACSCLSLTLFELINCDNVQISADNSLLADQDVIVIGRDTLLLSDDTQLPVGD